MFYSMYICGPLSAAVRLLLLLMMLLQDAPSCSCSAPLIAAATAAAVGCQTAAPSAAGCTSCSTARTDPSCSTAIAAPPDCVARSALARTRTQDPTIGTQPTTVPVTQDLFNQAQSGHCGSILEHSADVNPQFK